MKIKEYQYEIGDSTNFQERIIIYDTWDEYVEDITTFDGQKHIAYPSIPRQTAIYNVIVESDQLSFSFNHRLFKKEFKHISKIVHD